MIQLDPNALAVATREWVKALSETTPRQALEAALRAYLGALCHAHVRHPTSYELRTGQQVAGLHPDAVAEAVRALEFYGGDCGPFGADAIARALIAARSWEERQAAEERLHERRREDPVRLLDLSLCLDRARMRAGGRP
jgi:hypothetical protein